MPWVIALLTVTGLGGILSEVPWRTVEIVVAGILIVLLYTVIIGSGNYLEAQGA